MRALADLNRFAAFLQDRHPALAQRIGFEILKHQPGLGEGAVAGEVSRQPTEILDMPGRRVGIDDGIGLTGHMASALTEAHEIWR